MAYDHLKCREPTSLVVYVAGDIHTVMDDLKAAERMDQSLLALETYKYYVNCPLRDCALQFQRSRQVDVRDQLGDHLGDRERGSYLRDGPQIATSTLAGTL